MIRPNIIHGQHARPRQTEGQRIHAHGKVKPMERERRGWLWRWFR